MLCRVLWLETMYYLSTIYRPLVQGPGWHTSHRSATLSFALIFNLPWQGRTIVVLERPSHFLVRLI
jgi:hypothetical protein